MVTLALYNTRLLVPIPSCHVIISFSNGYQLKSPQHCSLGAPSSSGIHTKLTINGFSDVNNMKVANPPDGLVTPAVVDHTPKPQTPSLQADDARLIEGKSTFKTNAYSRVGVLKPSTYSRSLIRSAKRQNLDCARCIAVHSLGIDHCHKHDGDKYGKGPHKRLRR